MPDSKAQYTSGVTTQKVLAQLDSDLAHKFDRAAERAAKFHDNWSPINLNDFVDRFAPGSTAHITGSKITFQAEGSNLQIVCDVKAGYCRLRDTTNTTKRPYLDKDGHNANNKKTSSGGETGRTQAEYNAVTHFRILKREEM